MSINLTTNKLKTDLEFGNFTSPKMCRIVKLVTVIGAYCLRPTSLVTFAGSTCLSIMTFGEVNDYPSSTKL